MKREAYPAARTISPKVQAYFVMLLTPAIEVMDARRCPMLKRSKP
jgi:hypothetical protein